MSQKYSEINALTDSRTKLIEEKRKLINEQTLQSLKLESDNKRMNLLFNKDFKDNNFSK